MMGVLAQNFEYRYNPYSTKLDRSLSLNQSGQNMTLSNLTTDNLLVINPPIECPVGTYLTYTNMSTAICIAAIRTTGENVTGDYIFDGTINVTGTSYASSFEGNIRGFREENITITVSGGIGGGTTSDCCDGNTVIQITAFPTSESNKYFFNVSGDVSVEVIQSNSSLQHIGTWLASYRIASNTVLDYNITGATIDEDFIIRARWKR